MSRALGAAFTQTGQSLADIGPVLEKLRAQREQEQTARLIGQAFSGPEADMAAPQAPSPQVPMGAPDAAPAPAGAPQGQPQAAPAPMAAPAAPGSLQAMKFRQVGNALLRSGKPAAIVQGQAFLKQADALEAEADKNYLAHMKGQAEATSAQIQQHKDSLAMAQSLFQGVHDDRSQQMALSAADALVQDPNVSAHLKALAGPTYDPARMAELQTFTRTAQQNNDAAELALRRQSAAIADSKNTQELRAKTEANIAEDLAAAPSKAVYDGLYSLWKTQAPEVISKFPEQFSPEAQSFAQRLAIGAKDVASQAETHRKNVSDETQRAQTATGGAGAGTGPEVSALRPDQKTANVPNPKLGGLTPNAVFQGGLDYALRGVIPTSGMGSNQIQMARRNAVQNQGAALAAAAGVDLPTLQAEYRANSAALSRIVPIFTLTSSSAGTANDNLGLALAQSANVPRTGSPLVNTFKQWVTDPSKGLSGNPELAKLQTYIYTAAREYAKVTSGSAASVQGLTDSASKKADELINSAQNPETFASVVQAMQDDMRNVTGNQLKQINATSDVIARFLAAASGTALPVGGGSTQVSKTPPTDRTQIWNSPTGPMKFLGVGKGWGPVGG